ncbi:MAG: UDP-3-O-acyl-N-acetylglucosamine deacetylase [Fimbriimonadales bacterium]|nr:UDP-3-O-acyl-N-acetylglucosamine deacetylase [Fimbriimonadales bacterium]
MASLRTLAATVRFEGVGLHTGEPCLVVLHPLEGEPSRPPKLGLPTRLLIRKDGTTFPARWDYVVDTTRATVVGDGTTRLSTIEHLMAALWITGITHCLIECVRGSEVPILDGSALPFVEVIRNQSATLSPTSELCAEEKPLPASECPILEVRADDRYLAWHPWGNALMGYIQFPEPLGVQAGAFRLADAPTEIAPARTFGFLYEAEALRKQGLAHGASLENALVISETGYHNPARFADEPLRHKLLDVLGDLYLCGAYVPMFTLVAIKPGHALNVRLAQQIAQWLYAEDRGWRS